MVVRLSSKIIANNPTSFADSAPLNPISGDEWVETATGTRYTYFADSNSAQWVQFDVGQPYAPTLNQTINIAQGATTGKSIAMAIVFGG